MADTTTWEGNPVTYRYGDGQEFYQQTFMTKDPDYIFEVHCPHTDRDFGYLLALALFFLRYWHLVREHVPALVASPQREVLVYINYPDLLPRGTGAWSPRKVRSDSGRECRVIMLANRDKKLGNHAPSHDERALVLALSRTLVHELLHEVYHEGPNDGHDLMASELEAFTSALKAALDAHPPRIMRGGLTPRILLQICTQEGWTTDDVALNWRVSVDKVNGWLQEWAAKAQEPRPAPPAPAKLGARRQKTLKAITDGLDALGDDPSVQTLAQFCWRVGVSRMSLWRCVRDGQVKLPPRWGGKGS